MRQPKEIGGRSRFQLAAYLLPNRRSSAVARKMLPLLLLVLFVGQDCFLSAMECGCWTGIKGEISLPVGQKSG